MGTTTSGALDENRPIVADGAIILEEAGRYLGVIVELFIGASLNCEHYSNQRRQANFCFCLKLICEVGGLSLTYFLFPPSTQPSTFESHGAWRSEKL